MSNIYVHRLSGEADPYCIVKVQQSHSKGWAPSADGSLCNFGVNLQTKIVRTFQESFSLAQKEQHAGSDVMEAFECSLHSRPGGNTHLCNFQVGGQQLSEPLL